MNEEEKTGPAAIEDWHQRVAEIESTRIGGKPGPKGTVEGIYWEPLKPAEVRITSKTGGMKGQKQARMGSLPPASLLAVAEVAGFGEIKYSRLNYMNGYDWSLAFDAMMRHLFLFWSGEYYDQESDLPHLAHAAWHCLTLMAFNDNGLGTDDRYKGATQQEGNE